MALEVDLPHQWRLDSIERNGYGYLVTLTRGGDQSMLRQTVSARNPDWTEAFRLARNLVPQDSQKKEDTNHG